MKCIITGINGLVGSNLASLLKKIGWHVCGVGRSDSTATSCDEYYTFDLCQDGESKRNFSSSYDLFIHCAATIGFDSSSYESVVKNGQMTLNALKLADSLGCKKFINISSIPVIGEPEIIPITEDHTTNPKSLYHCSKIFGEHICNYYVSDMNIVTLRIASPIGVSNASSGFFYMLIDRALSGKDINILGKGNRKQSYLDLRDLVEFISLIYKINIDDGIYNVCSDQSFSNLELAYKIKEISRSTSNIFLTGIDEQDNLDWKVDMSKLKNFIGPVQHHTIEETIQHIINSRH